MRMRLLLPALALLGALSPALGQKQAGPPAESACVIDHSSPDILRYRWQPGAVIRIFFQPGDFTGAERRALAEAAARWETALKETSAGISFADGGEGVPAAADQTILVKRDAGMLPGRKGQFTSTKSAGGYITAAVVSVRADVKTRPELRKIMQHELGHGLGLKDCPRCGGGRTVMNQFYEARVNGISLGRIFSRLSDAPTRCDIAQVARGYRPEFKPQSGEEVPLFVATDDHEDRGGVAVSVERLTPEALSTAAPEVGIGREAIVKAAMIERGGGAGDGEREFVGEMLEREAENTASLRGYTFRRDVLIQTIDGAGKVSGEYRRVSRIVLEDSGRRYERIISFPKPTLKKLIITDEDVSDLSGAQLLGVEVSKLDRYHFRLEGETEDAAGRALFVLSVTPRDLAAAKAAGERLFYGRVWVEREGMRIVRARGKSLPEGNQRFPTFDAERAVVDGMHMFPSVTRADDVLIFPQVTIHMRMVVSYTDYKRFKSDVRVIEDGTGITDDSGGRLR